MTKNIDIPNNKVFDLAKVGSVLLFIALPLVACGGEEPAPTRTSVFLSQPQNGWKPLQGLNNSNMKHPVTLWENTESGEYVECLHDREKADGQSKEQIGEALECSGFVPNTKVGLKSILYSASTSPDGKQVLTFYVDTDSKTITQCPNSFDKRGYIVQSTDLDAVCSTFEVGSLGDKLEFISFLKGDKYHESNSTWYIPGENGSVTPDGITVDVYPHIVEASGLWRDEKIGAPEQPWQLNIRTSMMPFQAKGTYLRFVSASYGDDSQRSEAILTSGSDYEEITASDWYRNTFPNQDQFNGTVIRCFLNTDGGKIDRPEECTLFPIPTQGQIDAGLTTKIVM